MEEIIQHVAKYLLGLLIASLTGSSIKLYLDVFKAKNDIAQLLQHRKDDLIEASAVKATATSLQTTIDTKIKDVIHEFSEQRHNDTQAFTNALHGLKETLIEMNSIMKHMKDDVDILKKGRGQ